MIVIPTSRILDWDSFHDVFSDVLGFPGVYGRNMNAWIDCLSCADDPDARMTTVHAPPGGVLTLQLNDVDDFAARCPEQYGAIVECTAFVNWRRIERGLPSVVALAFHKR